MMIKMIFSDFDYTLLNYYSDKNYFDEYQIGVLSKLKEKGIKFCIVTGRSVNFFEQFPNLLNVVDYIIGSNGSCVYDVKKHEYIYKRYIEKDILGRIIDYSIKNEYNFLLNCLNERYCYGNWHNVNCFEYQEDEENEYDCEQIVLSFPKKDSDNVVKFIEYLNNIIVNNVSEWNERYSIDINVKDVSKGNTINWLCSELNIGRKETICFGDGVNDISMFNSVGKSVSVFNASDNVKTQADEVALSCEENGVYKYIEDNVLDKEVINNELK